MRMTYRQREQEALDFVEEAGNFFKKAGNQGITTYTSQDIKAGCFLAIRWGCGNDCIHLMKLDEDFEPVLYQNDFVNEEEDEN